LADGELIVPRCDAPTLLDLVKEPPDEVAGAVEVRAEADRLPPIALWWNVGPCALLGHKPPDPVRIIAAICQQQGLRTKSAQESRAEAIVVRLTGGDAEHHRQAFAVHDSVDLRTPCPPPFSSMNSTPAASNARRIAKSFGDVREVSSSASSARRIVRKLTADRRARSSAVHLMSPRGHAQSQHK